MYYGEMVQAIQDAKGVDYEMAEAILARRLYVLATDEQLARAMEICECSAVD